jgi:hypothetical protein
LKAGEAAATAALPKIREWMAPAEVKVLPEISTGLEAA